MKNIFLICVLSLAFSNVQAADGDTPEENANLQTGTEKIATSNTRHTPNTRLTIEKELANILSTSLTEVIKLNALDEEFDLYYLAADEKEPIGSLLFFPDNRNHSDWPVTLNPLRTKLTEHKWQTAVLTLPDSIIKPIPERTNYEEISDNKSSDETTTDTETPSTEQALTEDANQEDSKEVTNTLAQISLSRAESAVTKLKENSDILIIIGIGQGATWATAYAATLPETEKENSQLILINPQQSNDLSASGLIDMISQLKINTLDIYTPQKNNSPSFKNQAKARKRAANKSDAEKYTQIKAPSSSWEKAGNNWLYKKVRGLLKSNIEKQLEEKAMEIAEPEPKEKMNQRPGALDN